MGVMKRTGLLRGSPKNGVRPILRPLSPHHRETTAEGMAGDDAPMTLDTRRDSETCYDFYVDW